MKEVPSPCSLLSLIGVETEGLLDYEGHGRAGIISIVRWKLRPVKFGADLGKGCPVNGQNGVICHFRGALPVSIWGHCSQVLVFTSTWGTPKGV